MQSVRSSGHKWSDFKVGDRVQLVAPFRCQGDSPESDQEWDEQITFDENGERWGTIVGFESDAGLTFPVVAYDNYGRGGGGRLLTDADRLEHKFEFEPVTNEEEQEAIRSILGE